MITIDTTHKDLEIVFSENLMWDHHFLLILTRLWECYYMQVFSNIQCVQFKCILYLKTILLDLTCSTVPFCGVLNFSVTFDPLKLCKEELPKFVCDSSLDTNKYSLRLPLMSEFEIRDLFFCFLSMLKQIIMHTLTYTTLFLLVPLNVFLHPFQIVILN